MVHVPDLDGEVMEYRRFAPGESVVSTFDYHKDRERAPHLEQPIHRWRLDTAAGMVEEFVSVYAPLRQPTWIVDLGCGDGGLLSLLKRMLNQDLVTLNGYDFQPSNATGWSERGVNAWSLDFVSYWDQVISADLYVMTEVLEHLEDPYQMLTNVHERGAAVVCSSPWVEGPGNIDGSHNWAWDVAGYNEMLVKTGFVPVKYATNEIFQVHLAIPKEQFVVID